MQSGGIRAEFLSALQQKYKCPLCEMVLRDPLQTACGHRFCESCLQPVLRKHGCEWSDEVRFLEIHTVNCPYQEVPCPNAGCSLKLSKMTLEEHSTNECPYKKEPCPYCQQPIDKTEQEPHFRSCPKFPVECPTGCGTTDIPHDSLKEHQTNECALAEVLCTFHTVGCAFKGLREEEKEHEIQNQDEHLQMMSKKIAKESSKASDVSRTVKRLSEENSMLRMQVSIQNETLATAMQNLRAIQGRLSKMEKAVSEQVQRKLETPVDDTPSITHLAAQVEEYGKALQQHESKMGAIQRQLARASPATNAPSSLGIGGSLIACERRVDRFDHQLTLHNVQLADHDLHIKLLQATSYDGTYIWKIDQWQQRMQDASSGKTPSIFCPGFYVGRFGYKLCARVYPTGDGMGKGSHLSMFFVVMRGEYDALLPWPFRQRVSFRLLDQNGGPPIEDAFRPDVVSASFKRPTTNMNVASGCPLFVSHSTLRTRGYVKDDIVFIRIDIDKAGLPPVCL